METLVDECRNFEYGEDDAFYRLSAELVLAVGNAEYFLGKLAGNWVRVSGALDEFHQDTDKITSKVAEELVSRGDIPDAVSLLLLCSREDDGLELLLKHLGSLAVLKPGASGALAEKREGLVRQGQGILAYVAEKGRRNLSPYMLEALNTMMLVIRFFDYFHELKMQEALEVRVCCSNVYVIVNVRFRFVSSCLFST
jgi:hypothetical protein